MPLFHYRTFIGLPTIGGFSMSYLEAYLLAAYENSAYRQVSLLFQIHGN